MERSVPGVMSPVWRGITVWQLPHRQIWWDPRWRTELAAVLAQLADQQPGPSPLSVYPPRQRSVHFR